MNSAAQAQSVLAVPATPSGDNRYGTGEKPAGRNPSICQQSARGCPAAGATA